MRRSLLLLIAIACVVSVCASGRLSARLALDGAVAFAFIPAFEVLSFAAIWPRLRAHARATGLTFGTAFDAFSAGNRPWLFWMLLLVLVGMLPPRQADSWILPLLLSSLVPFVLVVLADVRFVRVALGRPAQAARMDILLQRLIGWTGGVVYFLGIALWAEIVPRWHAWFGA
jgi:hypothetical protein